MQIQISSKLITAGTEPTSTAAEPFGLETPYVTVQEGVYRCLYTHGLRIAASLRPFSSSFLNFPFLAGPLAPIRSTLSRGFSAYLPLVAGDTLTKCILTN